MDEMAPAEVGDPGEVSAEEQDRIDAEIVRRVMADETDPIVGWTPSVDGPPPVPVRRLEPGPHLVELSIARPVHGTVLLQALAAMGWTDGDGGPPVLDQSQHDREVPFEAPDEETRARIEALRSSWTEWSDGRDAVEGETRVRFVGQLERAIEHVDTEDLVWIGATPIGFDPFADIRKNVVPFPLEGGRAYDVRFISRMKAQATRSSVLAVLALMGFRPLRLACLKKNMRLEGRRDVDCAVWCGAAIWEGPRTVLHAEDLLTFEDVAATGPVEIAT